MATLDLARLKLARKRRDLRQHQVSEGLGLSKPLYGLWERGEREPSLSNLHALARLFEVSVDWLLGAGPPEAVVGLNQHAGDYAPIIESREAALRVVTTPEGLHALAEDRALFEALAISAPEWRMLATLVPPRALSKQGYLAVLLAVRGQYPG